MIQDRPEILREMLMDMENVPAIYSPSNYWKNYQYESYKYINSNGISEFRSNKNMLWSFLSAVPDGVGLAEKPSEQGVLDKVTKDHYIRYFDLFELVDESRAEVLPRLPGTFDIYRDMFFEVRKQEQKIS